MEIKHFHTLALGATFVIDGEAFIKRSELVYTDALGMETYIDPLFDIKIGKMQEAGTKAVQAQYPPAVQAAGTSDATQSGTLSDTDVERIARRVAEILKGQ